MSNLVLVRHGESQWNLENRFTGWVDVELSSKGREEARLAGEKLKNIHFGHLFTSSLKRAIDTATIVTEIICNLNIPTTQSQALNERNYGDLQGLNKTEVAKKFGEEQVKIWRRSYDVKPPGGESLADTANRVLPYYQTEILPKLKQGQNVLVVAHGNSLRALVMQLEKLTPAQVLELNIPTGVPLLYELDLEGNVLSHCYL